jgi:hypothetical protein
MSNKITDIGKMRNKVSAGIRPGVFDGKKIGKLGTETNPAVVTVQTEKRLKEVTSTFQKIGLELQSRTIAGRTGEYCRPDAIAEPAQTSSRGQKNWPQ